MASVPFKMTVHSGFAYASGLLRLDDSALTVEFEVKDAMAGLIKTQHKVRIPAHLIDDVRFKRGWFGGRMLIRVSDLDLLDDISWREGHEFQVKIRRSDRDLADEFAEEATWLEDSEEP